MTSRTGLSESKHQRETNQPPLCGWKQWGLNFGEVDWQERIFNQQKLFSNRHKRWQAVEMVAVAVRFIFVPLIFLCLVGYLFHVTFFMGLINWHIWWEVILCQAKLSWHFQISPGVKKKVSPLVYFVCLPPWGQYDLMVASSFILSLWVSQGMINPQTLHWQETLFPLPDLGWISTWRSLCIYVWDWFCAREGLWACRAAKCLRILLGLFPHVGYHMPEIRELAFFFFFFPPWTTVKRRRQAKLLNAVPVCSLPLSPVLRDGVIVLRQSHQWILLFKLGDFILPVSHWNVVQQQKT